MDAAMARTPISLLAALVLSIGAAQAADVGAGEQVFKKCRACHVVGEDAVNRVGPQLNGLFGRPAGSVDGYRYSDANKNSGIVWSEENFNAYIRNPRAFMPGTKMVFVGLKKDDDVVNLTAYLGQFQADGTLVPSE